MPTALQPPDAASKGPAPSRTHSSSADINARAAEIGREVWDRLGDRRPSMLEARWWEDHLMQWATEDESIKVQMFRFVDVLPMLKTHESVVRHLEEYFREISGHLPQAARLGLKFSGSNTILSRAVAYNARRNVGRMARRFIAGETPAEIAPKVESLWNRGFAFSLDQLGEAVITDAEADAYQRQYLDLLGTLAPETALWNDDLRLDRGPDGPTPRLNVSLKLSALTSHFRPLDPEGTARDVLPRLRPILEMARDVGAFVHFDMEDRASKDLTYDLVRRVLSEDDFRDWPDTGVVLQAYLRDSEADFEMLRGFSESRGTPMWVRLVKGAYWDYETVYAAQRGWPVPVFERKPESDIQFERLADRLMRDHDLLHPAIASHNLRSLSASIASAEMHGVSPGDFELQMLYGMAEDEARVFSQMGHRVRVYTPFGDLVPGMAYLVRRLLENTSNDSFLKHSYDPDVRVEDLLMPPTEVLDAMPPAEARPAPEFENEPLTDFTLEENRDAFAEALEDVRGRLGEDYPLVIDGKAVDGRTQITSRNPSDKDEVIGTVASATVEQAALAVEAARKSQPQWGRLEADQRAEYLEVLAAELNARRLELAAWIVLEVGKPIEEADADVAEAIDFCRYYAEQARRLEAGDAFEMPGESNVTTYGPVGVAVVIAPWNFPLAILCGMTTAALAAGNSVVVKPAEQSSVVAAQFMQCCRDAGIPDGVLNFLPGIGEDVGPALVSHPETDLVAFTGSKAVGLAINEAASAVEAQGGSVARVIAEMGGKNAIVIDSDADLDEAVVGVIESAFGYAGQKCSACSRVVVLDEVRDQFLKRLADAIDSVKVGPAEDPGTLCGPVIDADAVKRLKAALKDAKEEHEIFAQKKVTDVAKKGHFFPPTVFVEIPPDDRLAQEELFGPILTVLYAADFAEAMTLANDSPYALVGGVYSRSPEHLKTARREFRVGNLYLNRPCTGALVARQPFGGFKLSGTGPKAGGPDYLKRFCTATTVTENTMRRGFTPPPQGAGAADASPAP